MGTSAPADILVPESTIPVLEQATELEFLQWIYENMDFGPAHSDVVDILKAAFVEETGKAVPAGYNNEV